MPKKDVTRIPVVSQFLMEAFAERCVMEPFRMPITFIDNEEYALDILNAQPNNSEEGVLLRPPITWSQAETYIKSKGRTWDGRTTWWKTLKDEAARITMTGGIVVSVGWDSNGLGKSRGFQLERILMVAHGGHWHDTLLTVERKVN
jgi:hypothetical protein